MRGAAAAIRRVRREDERPVRSFLNDDVVARYVTAQSHARSASRVHAAGVSQGSAAQQQNREHQPGEAGANHADPHPRARPYDGVPEPVVAKRVEERPGERGGCADGKEALERHAAGAGQQSSHVAQSADEPADEQPRHAVGGELAPKPLHTVWALAQATADA